MVHLAGSLYRREGVRENLVATTKGARALPTSAAFPDSQILALILVWVHFLITGKVIHIFCRNFRKQGYAKKSQNLLGTTIVNILQ